MDFSSGLANLEKSAENAKNPRRRDRDNNNNNNGEEQQRYQPRQRRGYDTTSASSSNRGGGTSREYHDNSSSSRGYYGGGRGGGGGGYERNREGYRGGGGGRGGGRGRGRQQYPFQNQHDRGGGSGSSHSQNYHQDRQLDSLLRFGYRLPRGPYQRPPPIEVHNNVNGDSAAVPAADATSDKKNVRTFHICLLLISIDDMPYEAIWREWATAVNNNKNDNDNDGGPQKILVSLVCHAKYPDKVKSGWLKQRMLLKPRRIVRGNSLSDPEFLSYMPQWGSVEITRAMIDLLIQGMEIGRRTSNSGNSNKSLIDPRFSANRFLVTNPSKSHEELAREDIPSVDKFIFISETCVPVTTLEECGKALFTPTITKAAATEREESSSKAVVPSEKSGTEEANKNNSKHEESSKSEQDNEAELSKGTKNEEKTAAVTDATKSVIYLDTSWVNARNFNSKNTPSNKYERDQFNNINRVIPKRYRWKADQWMVLSRVHAASILDLDHSASSPRGGSNQNKSYLWKSYRQINASDEMYFPTALALAGILLDPIGKSHNQHRSQQQQQEQQQPTASGSGSVASTALLSDDEVMPWLQRRRVTYVDWSAGARNPISFTNGIKDFTKVARLAREQKCLFARKFAPFVDHPGQDPSSIVRTGDISVDEWKQEMDAITFKSS